MSESDIYSLCFKKKVHIATMQQFHFSANCTYKAGDSLMSTGVKEHSSSILTGVMCQMEIFITVSSLIEHNWFADCLSKQDLLIIDIYFPRISYLTARDK